MNDPFNQLPTDPVWAMKADALAKQAAAELGCMIVLLVIQQPENGGKFLTCIEGVPDTGPLAELKNDVPGMMYTLGTIVAAQEKQERVRPN